MIRVSRAIIVMQLNKIKLSLLIHKARLTNSLSEKFSQLSNLVAKPNRHSADIYLQII